ncbi:uncharacterized protein I303_108617 [Kwoniella dejecticola CBS 10117]|uniref:Fe2OG dioxygenase domain-containing protein n=1 Tax=Kwoniella dejecticola CBS 10117 TaxID=1296121 RepID=A0A1A5ZWW3_9TREE|nr:uncharacterized protein I303_07058 [Kwoniella dejecticola CBS 10117]OBR82299.1 hypothetical protein I303_07058 [Kwoniella dejecticola CBS 10117]
MAAGRLPEITLKPDLAINTVLPSQIYTIDDFFSSAEVKAVRRWTDSVVMEDPKPAGKGAAERTARRGSLDSPDIAAILLNLLLPYIPQLSPAYTPTSKDGRPLLSPNIRVYHYPAKSYFRCHYDSPTLDPASRRLSCWTILIYLSDVQGGATAFYTSTHDTRDSKNSNAKLRSKTNKGLSDEKKISVEPKAGRMLLHWHGMKNGGCLKHEGEEVVKGDKWVLRTDLLA